MFLLSAAEPPKAAVVGEWLDMPESSVRVLGIARRGTRDSPWVHLAPWHRELQVPTGEGGAQDPSLGLVVRGGTHSPDTAARNKQEIVALKLQSK